MGGEKWESKQMDGHKRQKHKEETLTYKYTQQSSIDNSKLKTWRSVAVRLSKPDILCFIHTYSVVG